MLMLVIIGIFSFAMTLLAALFWALLGMAIAGKDKGVVSVALVLCTFATCLQIIALYGFGHLAATYQ